VLYCADSGSRPIPWRWPLELKFLVHTKPILLVEDQEDDVFLMRRALRSAGVANPLQVAEDGQAALDYLFGRKADSKEPSSSLPILVLLDLKLPLVSGHTVLERIRNSPELTNIVVVVVSSSSERSDVHKAYSLGANSYLVKPSSSEELLELSQLIKRYWLNFNRFDEPPPRL